MSEARRTEPDAPTAPALRWDELVRRLVAYARRLGASSEEAEDVVQDSLELVVRDPAWLDEARSSHVTALSTVLRNRLFDRYRHLAVRARTAPKLRLLGADDPSPPDERALADARTRRRALLALLEPAERAVFGAWLQQRRGDLDGPAAAASIGHSLSDFEGAKKRLRRRCQALLVELDLEPTDLFDPQPPGGER